MARIVLPGEWFDAEGDSCFRLTIQKPQRPLSRLAVRRLMLSILPLLLDGLVAMSPVVGAEALWQCLACNAVYLVEGAGLCVWRRGGSGN